MNKRFQKNKYTIFVVMIVFAIGLLIFLNYLYAENYPGGKYFQTQWIAARRVLTEGQSPYSDQLLYEIQMSAYGRPAMVGEYEFRFMYPYFSLIIFTPFGLIKDFVLARAIWMAFLELLLIGIYFLSTNLVNWRPKLIPGIALFLISITFYHNIRAVVDGNLMLVITFLLVATLIAIRDRKDEAAGIMLAFTTLEIQYVLVGIVLILVFLLVNKRYKIVGYLFGSLFLLYGFSSLFLPEWLAGYAKQLTLSITTDPLNTFSLLLQNSFGDIGGRISIALMVIISTVILFEWFFIKNATFTHFLWIFFLTIVISQWLGIPAEPTNFIILFPGLIYSLKAITERWQNKGEAVVLIIGAFLYLVTWILFFLLQDKHNFYYDNGTFFVILPMAELLLLYWSRWWVISGKSVAKKVL